MEWMDNSFYAAVALVIFLGMKTYARIQKYSFYAGMLGLLIVVVLLFTGSPDAFKAGQDAGRPYLVVSQGAWSCQRSVRWRARFRS